MAPKYIDTKNPSKELSKFEKVNTICVEAYEKIEVVYGTALIHIFEEGIFCRKTIKKLKISYYSRCYILYYSFCIYHIYSYIYIEKFLEKPFVLGLEKRELEGDGLLC